MHTCVGSAKTIFMPSVTYMVMIGTFCSSEFKLNMSVEEAFVR